MAIMKEAKTLTFGDTQYVVVDAEDREKIAEFEQLVDCNIKPVAKTAEMTIPVGMDSEGGLWTEPSLTATQISALDGMFKIAAYTENADAAYTAFKIAFGIGDSGEVHTHSYTSKITTAATCTTAGVRTYTCTCGDRYTEAIPAIGHNYVDGTCANCGAADPDAEPEVTLTSISATYSGGDVPVGTAVNDLTGIVVTAHYSDGTSEAVTGYTLSGTIAEGNNTIAVSHGGKTTTFTVIGLPESDGTEWTDGVPYEYTLVENEYVGEEKYGGNGLKPYNGWSRTPFLPCKGASSIVVTHIDKTNTITLKGAYGCWYDANKKYITHFSQTAANLATVPSDACFVILSQSDAIMNNIASITPHA